MKKILIMTGAGYAFEQLHLQLIKKLGDKFHLHLIINNFHLNKNLINLTNELISSGIIKSYEIANISSKKGVIEKIIHYTQFFKSLIKKEYDYLIVSEDGSAYMRLLITKFRKQGGKIILINNRTLGAYYYKRWYGIDGKFNATPLNINKEAASYSTRIYNKINEFGWFNFLFKVLTNKNYYITLFDYKILPFLLNGAPLPSNNMISLNITGFADYTIVFNQSEYDSFKVLIPSINNLILAKHPIVGYCKNNKIINNSFLLVLIPPFLSEDKISDNKMQRWISTIQIVKKLKKPSEIHLRFHPNENKKFIIQFEKELSLNNIQFTTINATKVSIINSICNVMGVISSPSSSLKIFRWATKETFALCLEGMGGVIRGEVQSDKMFYMGDTEGIKKINNNKDINMDILTPPKNLPFDNYPTVENYLSKIL